MDYISFSDAISNKRTETNKFKSQRNSLFFELYSYYYKNWKRNTWSHYIKWLKENHFKHSSLKVQEFKKTKHYYKEDSVKKFCSYRLGFIKTEDIYYLISIAKDMENRGENFNSWLFWSIKYDGKKLSTDS